MEFLSLNGGCTGSSESTLVKIPHCWKSHVTAHVSLFVDVLVPLPRGAMRYSVICDCTIIWSYSLVLQVFWRTVSFQWRSQNAEKVAFIKGRQLDQAVILSSIASLFEMATSLNGKNLLPKNLLPLVANSFF